MPRDRDDPHRQPDVANRAHGTTPSTPSRSVAGANRAAGNAFISRLTKAAAAPIASVAHYWHEGVEKASHAVDDLRGHAYGPDVDRLASALDRAIARRDGKAVFDAFDPIWQVVDRVDPPPAAVKHVNAVLAAVLTSERVDRLAPIISGDYEYEGNYANVFVLPAGKRLEAAVRRADQPRDQHVDSILSSGDPVAFLGLFRNNADLAEGAIDQRQGDAALSRLWSGLISLIKHQPQRLRAMLSADQLTDLFRMMPAPVRDRVLNECFGMRPAKAGPSSQGKQVAPELENATLVALVEAPRANLDVLQNANVETTAKDISFWDGKDIAISRTDKDPRVAVESTDDTKNDSESVLHELGHAVDQSLGFPSHNEQLFGWQTFATPQQLATATRLDDVQARNPKVAAVLQDCYNALYAGHKVGAALIAETAQQHGVAHADLAPFTSHIAYQVVVAPSASSAPSNGTQHIFFNDYYKQGYAIRNEIYNTAMRIKRPYALYAPYECFAEFYVAWFSDPHRPALPPAIANYYQNTVAKYDGHPQSGATGKPA